MARLEPQIKSIRVPASAWAIAYYILRTGKDTFRQSELKGAACGALDSALADGLIVKLDNGLYRANVELAKFYASLLPKAYINERRGRFWTPVSEAKTSCEEREEAFRLASAWLRLAKWSERHIEDRAMPPNKILETLNKHGIEVQRMALPSGAKAIVAKVLNYYIIMDRLMAKNTPKCIRYPRLGPDAWLCSSTKDKLYWYLKLAPRPQN
jgi:hypothetical protein